MVKRGWKGVGLPPIRPKGKRRRHAPEAVSRWVGDLEKAVRLVHEAAKKLHKLDSSHRLLLLWFVRRGKLIDEEAEKRCRIEMKNRFGNGAVSWEDEANPVGECLVVLNNYRLALEKAIKEIIQKINWETQILPGLLKQRKIQKERQEHWRKQRQPRSVPLLLKEDAA